MNTVKTYSLCLFINIISVFIYDSLPFDFFVLINSLLCENMIPLFIFFTLVKVVHSEIVLEFVMYQQKLTSCAYIQWQISISVHYVTTYVNVAIIWRAEVFNKRFSIMCPQNYPFNLLQHNINKCWAIVPLSHGQDLIA